MLDRYNDILLKDLKAENPKNILDAGCGEGFFIQRLIRSGFREVYGFDASAEAVEQAKKLTGLPGKNIWREDVYSLKREGGTFDSVLCFEVLEHLEDPAQALNGISRLAGQTLYLTVPKEPYFCLGNLAVGKNILRLGNDADHKHLWNGKTFRKFAGEVLGENFSLTALEPVIFPWTILKCRRNA